MNPQTKLEKIARVFSVQKSFEDLGADRVISEDISDKLDLLMFDGLRVILFIWLLAFGTCMFSISSSTSNPWVLNRYFHTVAFTAVYAANMGFDQLFLISSFFATLKVISLLRT